MKRPEDTILRVFDKAIKKIKSERKRTSKLNPKQTFTIGEMSSEKKTKQKKKRSTYSGKQKVILKDMLKNVKDV